MQIRRRGSFDRHPLDPNYALVIDVLQHGGWWTYLTPSEGGWVLGWIKDGICWTTQRPSIALAAIDALHWLDEVQRGTGKQRRYAQHHGTKST